VAAAAVAAVGRVGRVSKAWLRMSCTSLAVAEIFCSSVKVSMRNAYNLTEADVDVDVAGWGGRSNDVVRCE